MSQYPWYSELLNLSAAIKAAFSIQDYDHAVILSEKREQLLKSLSDSKSVMNSEEWLALQSLCLEILNTDKQLTLDIETEKEVVHSKIQTLMKGSKIINQYNKNR